MNKDQFLLKIQQELFNSLQKEFVGNIDTNDNVINPKYPNEIDLKSRVVYRLTDSIEFHYHAHANGFLAILEIICPNISAIKIERLKCELMKSVKEISIHEDLKKANLKIQSVSIEDIYNALKKYQII